MTAETSAAAARRPDRAASHMPGVLPADWRLVRTPAAPGGWNMACDLTLLDLARQTGDGFLRVYGWSRPTVSFGRNEQISGKLSAERLDASGLDMVRRPTGGRALLHHREVTYSVAIPLADDLRWHQAYRAINALLLRAMVRMGVPAQLGQKSAAVSASGGSANQAREVPHGEVCFSGIAEGEIVVGARKLVASSVWRERGAYLQHGSILLQDEQGMLANALGPHFAPSAPAAVLSEWARGTETVSGACDIVERALHATLHERDDTLCGNARHWSIPADIVPAIESRADRLLQPDWLWRR